MSDRGPRRGSPWVRTFWILFGLFVGLIVIAFFALETLAPAALPGGG